MPDISVYVAGVPRAAEREVNLISHKRITCPLCTLSGPTNRSIPDSKMVTECAKCVPAPQEAPAPATFAPFCRPRTRADGDQQNGIIV